MYISNYTNPTSVRSLLLEGRMLGMIVKTPEDLGKDNVAGVYINKLMFGLPISEGPYEKKISIDTSKCLNSVNKDIGKKQITVKNYVTLAIAQSNNVVPPKFARGENVFIETCDMDLKNMYILPYALGEVNKRKNDKFTVMVPNFKEYDRSVMERNNTFGFELDSKNKIISLWTSKEGGEESSKAEKGVYYLAFNAADGTILLTDSAKRTIKINSDDDSISLENESETSISLDKDTINMKAKTMNIEVENDINVKSDTLSRNHTEIKTKADKDTEEVDTLNIKGNSLESNYDTTKIKSTSYENTTKKWKTDSPISGFTKVLTANSFSIWGQAGMNPLPTCANIDSSGIFHSGNPSSISIGLAKAQPLLVVLQTIAAKLDVIASVVGCPPTSVAAVTAAQQLITSMNSMG